MSRSGRQWWGLVGVAAVLALAGGTAQAPAAPIAGITVSGVGFQTPESVLYDPVADTYLVSNINGNPTAADDNGFISRVLPSGRVVALKWIDGAAADVTLHAPKGMAIVGDTLYVTDITVVRTFDRRTGKAKGAIEVAGATFMNDLAAGRGGAVYATDSGLKPDFSPSGTDAVYRIDATGKVTAVARATALNHPNGVAVRADGTLVVVTFSEKGDMYTISPAGIRRALPAPPKGQLDGVELLPGGAMLVSSWAGSAVYRIDARGTATVAVANVASPADIGYDRRRGRVLIPLFMKNAVVIQTVR
ncbi:MAG: SMP-30/gluconolactonase/LRE family protein [Armatimonadota bacterium]|nr:SMP-30/gluconolactonase/LRE family protein [Armatimonadota bacterium]MDR7486122.1 SMP-30/gluconolactonase/LRE family protein [Armatimonadota bacterium]MDR7531753.1 SMP-30/gluconolactonase/LRE family protein [Armatimonadota bacterium]MDR7534902.1 SMP-30/gluconolactonase/LRE family protein [Armatimonadota bacterium]